MTGEWEIRGRSSGVTKEKAQMEHAMPEPVACKIGLASSGWILSTPDSVVDLGNERNTTRS